MRVSSDYEIRIDGRLEFKVFKDHSLAFRFASATSTLSDQQHLFQALINESQGSKQPRDATLFGRGIDSARQRGRSMANYN